MAEPARHCPTAAAPIEALADCETAFQPIFDLGRGRIEGYEALVRGPLGEGADWVFAQVPPELSYPFDLACRLAAIDRASGLGLRNESLALNILPNALLEPRLWLSPSIQCAIRCGIPLESLVLELSEIERIPRPDLIKKNLRAARDLGVRFALDDFGTGHANLGLLAEFQPDIVKLDRTLVSDLAHDQVRQSIVEGTLKICRDLGIEVVAEGVETRDQCAALVAMGVRKIQGFYISPASIGALPFHLPRD